MMIGHDPTNPLAIHFLISPPHHLHHIIHSRIDLGEDVEIMMGFHPLPKTLLRQGGPLKWSSRGEHQKFDKKSARPTLLSFRDFPSAVLTHLPPMLDMIVHMNPHSSSFLLSHIHGDCTYESHSSLLLSYASS
ncbi:hypothetical protein LOK49_LG06G02197 [Camellia lanceoleosa]|uniref:Uncharacterized protein n=1 Tax=Camellia lanceoleosa TaxID=1840588 RepID=A0ACC0HG69_9ERIC|nr:hypothetical protein LOK49_LG06G02197 [Camellia lanceoleosa]